MCHSETLYFYFYLTFFRVSIVILPLLQGLVKLAVKEGSLEVEIRTLNSFKANQVLVTSYKSQSTEFLAGTRSFSLFYSYLKRPHTSNSQNLRKKNTRV